MRKGKKNKWTGRSSLKVGVVVIVCGVFAWLLYAGVFSFLSNAAYFQVKKVTFVGLDETDIVKKISKQLMYGNIFNLDIASIAKNFKRAYPQFYDVVIVRNLPDELVVKVIRRKPLAQIEQKGFFLVDDEGVIVSDASKHPFDDYIAIEGLKGLPGLSFGKKINSPELVAGLQLAEMLGNRKDSLLSLMPRSSRGTLMRIDVVLYPSLYVYFNTLELRFHADSLQTQLTSLFNVLPSLEERINQVKYIDLRFGDPAVSF